MKQKILLLTSIFFTSILFKAQAQTILQTISGSYGDDKAYTMAITNDKGFIVGGNSYSGRTGEKGDTSRGGWDMWIVKYNSDGNIQWQRTLGGSKDDYCNDIVQTKDGGYLVGGYSLSGLSGDKTQDSKGDYDYWIIKLNAYGTKLWDKSIGGSATDILSSIKQTNDGGYILGGHSASVVSGDKTATNYGGYDFWLVKTDSSGNKIWDKSYGGTQWEYMFDVEITKDGGYILGGITYSFTHAPNSDDYWLVKTDKNGVLQWSKNYGGTSSDNLAKVKQTVDGGYILGGSSLSDVSGDKTSPNLGGDDYWVIKTDALGTIQWDKTVGGNNWEELYDIKQTKDKGYILAGGSSSSMSGNKTENSRGYYDYWAVKLDSSSNIQWDKTIGANNDDVATAVSEADSGNYLIAGYSSSGKNGDKKSVCRGLNDYWTVLSREPVTAIAAHKSPVMEDKFSISILPNPATNYLNIGNLPAGKIHIKVVDFAGFVKLQATTATGHLYSLNVSALKPGNYIVKIDSGKGTISKHFIKE